LAPGGAPTFPYRIETATGRGATSTVFRATDTRTATRVALKVGHRLAERQRLADEAERLAFVHVPGLPRVLDAGIAPEGAGEIAGRPYLALEWVSGYALDVARVPDARRRLFALAVARDVGEALAELHATGVAHGDVKPENVVVDERRDGAHAVLVDLGLSARADAATPEGGTVRYLAPEWTAPEAVSDARARDLWALGLTIAEIASAEVAKAADARRALDAVLLPPDIDVIVRALLATAPGARPGADWVARRARLVLGDAPSQAEVADRRRRAVQRAYLGVRRRELSHAARGSRASVRIPGTAGAWLESTLDVLARVAELRGATTSGESPPLVDLDVLGRSRFLTALIGSAAASFPPLAVASDSDLVDRLLARVENVDPRTLTYADLGDFEVSVPEEPKDVVELSFALGAPSPSAAVLDAAERWVLDHEAPSRTLAFALGRALRLRGELGRALVVLSRADGPDAEVEAAECERRGGDRAAAEARLARLSLADLGEATAARFLATRARLVLDERAPERALAMLADASGSAAVCEARALCELARGRLDRARLDTDRALALAATDEERARALALAGNLAHASGEPARALEAFRRAADHAVRAGAVLEEATYLTGIAAAGLDSGALAEALESSTRAALLFEALGRSGDAARALLARAAVFGAAGALEPAREAAEEAIARARASGDVRCRAYAHLVLADVLPPGHADGLEHARRAKSLLEGAGADDRLRVAARLLRRGAAVDRDAEDQVAEGPDVPVPARLEWWGARAALAAREPSPERPDRVLSALGSLASLPGPVPTRGEALAAAAELAAKVGDGESARRFAAASAEAARTLARSAPLELRAGIPALEWVRATRSPREAKLAPEQLADVEALVHALGTRDRLRPLLDQVLDALVLWTGVERGLLLLSAPGGRLVPRAARNIARRDLAGAQLALSRSLAERALATGEPVVAVDAAGELPEVHASVHALKLRSVLAVPLVARGRPLGVVYLDDRMRRGAFGPGELAWVRLVAALAAVAIGDARDQLALRRAARRAARAEARLAANLARREAELDLAERELARATRDRGTRFGYDGIVGESASIRDLLRLLDRVAPTEVPVLVTGESGSGKELVARAIHQNGPRRSGPFVSENCGAIPEGLLESTLFGHVRGAFTGAARPRAGLFEIASGGTLFLDEIGEMSLGMQTKLLRVLEDGEVRPVGSERARKVDVRVIGATHRDLKAMVEANTFRRDLFYRLDVIRVDVPPLRSRTGDVELLALHFIRKHAGARSVGLSRAAAALLAAYSWPGNIRQLENEIRRALVLADDVIRPEHLSPEVREGPAGGAGDLGLNVRKRIDALEEELVTTALERTSGNQTRAAELLGLSRFGLQKMMRRLGIRVPPPLALRDEPGAVTGVR
jgi:transcriptional regulator with GAF, ATPase, and Fis domain/serine/threonine protein kinase